ncbi:MAG: DUF4143 domain-containing protein [Propionibacteriaceae bacterium]|nr:DUF4143 domain-containing protein [Propionibacteriaceae bacterium]
MSFDYVQRHADAVVSDLLGGFPALMLTGSRGCGKTTTAARNSASVIRLDDRAQASAFSTYPDDFLKTAVRPVLIDEWQEVPESLASVKRAVDQNHAPGQFLITGSVRSRFVSGSWPGTGRIVPVRMWGFTQAESVGNPGCNLDWLWAPETIKPGTLHAAPTILDYAEMALAGGFPQAIHLSPAHRATWYEGYVDQLIHHDVIQLADVRATAALGRLLTATAINTAGTPSVASLAQAIGADQRTVTNHLDALEEMHVIQRMQPWFRNQMVRLVKSRKYYVTDAGLAASLIHADISILKSNGKVLGQLIDTFVTAQIRPLADLAQPRIGMFYVRSQDGRHEVDIVLEAPGRGIVGIEVKSASSVNPHDARHLTWLQGQVQDEFVAGYVFHSGTSIFPLGSNQWAVPIAALWQGVGL